MASIQVLRGAGGRFAGSVGGGHGHGGAAGGGAAVDAKRAALRQRVKAAQEALDKIRAQHATKVPTAKPKATKPTSARERLKTAVAKRKSTTSEAKVKPAAGEKRKVATESKAKAHAEKAKAAEAKRSARAEKLKQAAAKKAERDKARGEAKAKKEADLQARHKAGLEKAKAQEQKRVALQAAKEARAAAKQVRAKPKESQFAQPGAKTAELKQALASRDGKQVRALLQEHIEATLPGIKTWDRSGPLQVHSDAAWKAGGNAHAAALHAWNGEVHTREGVFQRAQQAGTLLHSGAFSPKDGHFGEKELDALGGLHVLIHEELHGMSRSSPMSYQKYGAVLEEVGVELSARHVTRNLTPQLSTSTHSDVAFHFAPGAFLGAYRGHINNVLEVISDHTGMNFDQAAKAVVVAHTAATASAQRTKFHSPGEHLDAFMRGLKVTPEQSHKIRAELEQLEI